ncbi:MAG: hypothetical protein IJS39_02300 [Synergistaceae bacterium]|nr:hypothetical protein [Synergistaceae bacterium]
MPLTRNWFWRRKTYHTLEEREKATGKEGAANNCEHGVQLFYSAYDGIDDKTISPDDFSQDFEITSDFVN